tara:strand:+ start:3347 stop:4033 length:687 start_codon:yes stop_codon:yes gene_type:complete
MTLQLIDKSKIYFYLVILLFLLSVHNLNLINSINNFFKVKKIILIGSIDDNLDQEISSSLDKFYNYNIFSLDSDEIKTILNNFDIISEYKIKKEYPGKIKIELKETNILAYFFDENRKTFIGENGKKIKEKKIIKEDLPLIVGQVDVKSFLKLKKILIDYGFKLNDFNTFYYFKSNRWDLFYKNKILVKLPTENLDSSINLFKEIIEKKNIKNLKIIDLRIKNSVILS